MNEIWDAVALLTQASLWVAAVRIATPLIFGTLCELICKIIGIAIAPESVKSSYTHRRRRYGKMGVEIRRMILPAPPVWIHLRIICGQ